MQQMSSFLPLIASFPADCALSLTALACARTFQRCNIFKVVVPLFAPLNFVLPSPPCYSMCQAILTNTNCNNKFQQLLATNTTASLSLYTALHPKQNCTSTGSFSYSAAATMCGMPVASPSMDYPYNQTIVGKLGDMVRSCN